MFVRAPIPSGSEAVGAAIAVHAGVIGFTQCFPGNSLPHSGIALWRAIGGTNGFQPGSGAFVYPKSGDGRHGNRGEGMKEGQMSEKPPLTIAVTKRSRGTTSIPCHCHPFPCLHHCF
jgi:hypothetical protein